MARAALMNTTTSPHRIGSATTSGAAIAVDGLCFEYPGLRALDEVGFEVAAGSITALVGPNGAGKTTLLRCLAGIDRPLTGSIHVNGVDVIEDPRRSHLGIGYLSDFFGLYGELSVRRGLAYVAAANGLDRAAAGTAIDRTAAALDITGRLEQRAGSLSRGLRQRVAIAQAIIHAPPVILLDEPAAGLDPAARFQLGELFAALGRSGHTLIVSSHILAELEAYSSDMLVLRGGRIVEHRALARDAPAGGEIELVVTTDPQAALRALADDPRVSGVDASDARIRLHFAGDAAARAALLARLVGDGIGIAAFAPLAEDLQQSYLRSLDGSGADES